MIAAPVVPLLQHAGCSDQCGTFLPQDDGPPVVVVGSLALNDSVVALARRHGLDAVALLQFARSGQDAGAERSAVLVAGD